MQIDAPKQNQIQLREASNSTNRGLRTTAEKFIAVIDRTVRAIGLLFSPIYPRRYEALWRPTLKN